GFVAPPTDAATFETVFTSTSGSTMTKSLNVSAGNTVEHSNVLSEFFLLNTSAIGSMTIQASSPDAHVYSALVAGTTQSGGVPVIEASQFSSATGTSQPVHYDGMEQSTDPTRGTRWNLYIQETSGQSGKVRISIYESGNRSTPIVEKDFPVASSTSLALETVFAAVGLESELRRKDRTGVLCVLRPVDGNAVITASAIEIDNTTGAAQVHPLEPGTGLTTSLVTVKTLAGQGGDANGDGTVTVSDIFYLINNLFAGGPGPVGSGDANGDGTVSVADIFYLINHLFAGGPAPV
ncbi:MAG: dockerin type I repeat-containing protein, partial [Acidobacteria bacterium]|nr:dockerin type I repeat-containing protein [Acidobacteriota bacterium]